MESSCQFHRQVNTHTLRKCFYFPQDVIVLRLSALCGVSFSWEFQVLMKMNDPELTHKDFQNCISCVHCHELAFYQSVKSSCCSWIA